MSKDEMALGTRVKVSDNLERSKTWVQTLIKPIQLKMSKIQHSV